MPIVLLAASVRYICCLSLSHAPVIDMQWQIQYMLCEGTYATCSGGGEQAADAAGQDDGTGDKGAELRPKRARGRRTSETTR